MLININSDLVKALNALKTEMLTQDDCCQAAPRFWMISEETIEYGVAEEHADAFYLIDKDGNIVGKKVKDYFDIITALKDEILENREACDITLEIVDGKHLNVHIDYDDESYEDGCINDAEDAAAFLNESGFEYSLCGIRFNTTIVRGPLFLTKKACVDHIAKYGYLYKNPKPYAMTAHRSPEIEMICRLVETTKWEPALNRVFNVTNIDWDTSGDIDWDADDDDLRRSIYASTLTPPTELAISIYDLLEDNEDPLDPPDDDTLYDRIADYLSDRYGYCVFSFATR